MPDGAIAKICASRNFCAIARVMRMPIALASASRSDQSLSLTKPMPEFCPLPPVLKPATAMTESTSGCWRT